MNMRWEVVDVLTMMPMKSRVEGEALHTYLAGSCVLCKHLALTVYIVPFRGQVLLTGQVGYFSISIAMETVLNSLMLFSTSED